MKSENDHEKEKRKRGITIPASISILLMPVLIPALLIGAGLSYPYGAAKRFFDDRREKRFAIGMWRGRRGIGLAEFIKAVEEKRGTVIVEQFSLAKGPIRVWWTSEDIAVMSPHPLPEGNFGFLEAPEFCDWCYARYSNPATGIALLSDEAKKKWPSIRHQVTTGNCVRIYLPKIRRVADALPKE